MVELRYVILFVSDLDRSIRFYRDVLGMSLRSDTGDQVELEVGSLGLTLHQAHSDASHHHSPTVTGSIRLGLHLKNLTPVIDRLNAAGALCLAPPEERDGVIMALYEDPDGYHLSLAAERA
jgi:lactoylglutathione lyase